MLATNQVEVGKLAEALVQWIVFSVIIALSPILYNLLKRIGTHKNVGVINISPRGELLLVSAAISASAIGKILLIGSTEASILKLIFGGSCVLMLMITSAWFADISTRTDLKENMNDKAISKISIIIFFLTIFVSTVCVVLTEVAK